MGDALLIFGNRALRNLEGLNSLHGVLRGAIGIEANPALENVDALAGIEGVADANVLGNAVEVAQNPQLASLGGFSGLEGQLGGALTIKDNDALASLDGLQGVEGLGEYTLAGQALVVSGNTALTDVEGLSGIGGTLQGVAVADSPLLSSVAPVFEGANPVTQAAGKVTIDGVECISADEQRSRRCPHGQVRHRVHAHVRAAGGERYGPHQCTSAPAPTTCAAARPRAVTWQPGPSTAALGCFAA